ncbi:(Fe-S)-binding protein [Parasulfuritortus cantonensis]|uniref:(Fe-S)-binding protein n=1 Tax=Parasulfuritortus cantonensis TaxID=2528202 RepID=A0A4V2NVT1_9PROT|nr:4Fe-4S dicluster domain-containing protein [Parasulfuritortus cantonensis]TCJ14672.1 (Fe-S)-binding protein [Parasulfuritortus cantonensis]
MKTHLDWSAYDTYGAGDAYAGIPATGGNYAKAVAVCMNNRQCQRDGKGVMCPSYRVTGDPAHSTQARVAAFKAALNGELGDDPFAHPALAEAMELCVSCKACKKECPSAVDMTLIKTEYLAQRNERLGAPLRSRLLAGLPAWLHRRRRALATALRWRARSPLLARLAEKLLGIAARRPLPAPAPQPFAAIAPEPAAEAPRGTVILFVDTFSHHFEPEVAEDARAVLEAAGYRVRVARPAPDDAEPERPLCCGRTYLSAGLVEQARHEARRTLAALAPALAEGVPVVGLEPSCLLALRDEFYCLGLGPDVAPLAKQAWLFEEFLLHEYNKGLRLPLKPITPGRALVHGHCHQKAFGAMKSVRKVLGWIPGFEFELIESSCCGMAGAFGLEAEHYDISMQMAEQALLPAVRAAGDAVIVADGFSCRHQIEDGSGRKPIHVATLLHLSMTGTQP